MRHVVIIGNGITGSTVARNLRKRGNDEITLISSETGHFFSRTALMYIYMGHMTYQDTKPYEDWFWEKNRIRLVHDHVERVDTPARQVHLRDSGPLAYDVLVVACGSRSNKFGWPGQDLQGVQGLYSYQDVETLERHTPAINRAVIVGGGLIGVELAEMFLSRDIPVTFLVREEHFWGIVLPDEEADLVARHIREHHVALRMQTELKEILPDKEGRVRGIVTNHDETLDCQFVGLTVGVSPNIGFLEGSGIETDRGVLVDPFFGTSIPDVYAGGDCAQHRHPPPGRRPVEQVWYTGKMHGEHITTNLSGEPAPYDPGIWFNSAKFFDIEYQTYGTAPSTLPEDQATLYWEHPSGRKCIRINYRKEDRRVVAFNLFGIRGRHTVCEDWIESGATLEQVLENLAAMNFDPEFFVPFEREVLSAYARVHPEGRVDTGTGKGLFTPYMRTLFQRRNQTGGTAG